MSRFVKVISPNNGNGWYWEVRTIDGELVIRGLGASHGDAQKQAEAAKAKAAAPDRKARRPRLAGSLHA